MSARQKADIKQRKTLVESKITSRINAGERRLLDYEILQIVAEYPELEELYPNPSSRRSFWLRLKNKIQMSGSNPSSGCPSPSNPHHMAPYYGYHMPIFGSPSPYGGHYPHPPASPKQDHQDTKTSAVDEESQAKAAAEAKGKRQAEKDLENLGRSEDFIMTIAEEMKDTSIGQSMVKWATNPAERHKIIRRARNDEDLRNEVVADITKARAMGRVMRQRIVALKKLIDDQGVGLQDELREAQAVLESIEAKIRANGGHMNKTNNYSAANDLVTSACDEIMAGLTGDSRGSDNFASGGGPPHPAETGDFAPRDATMGDSSGNSKNVLNHGGEFHLKFNEDQKKPAAGGSGFQFGASNNANNSTAGFQFGANNLFGNATAGNKGQQFGGNPGQAPNPFNNKENNNNGMQG